MAKIIPNYNLTLNKEGTTVLYPLTEHVCAIMEGRTTDTIDADIDRRIVFCNDDFVRLVNICEYTNAKRHVISSSNSNLEFIRDLKEEYGKEIFLKDIQTLI